MLNILNSMTRTTGCNSALLGKLIKSTGKSVRKIACEVEVSPTLLWRLNLDKYSFVVKEGYRKRICDYFEVSEDDLFPFVSANKEKAS